MPLTFSKWWQMYFRLTIVPLRAHFNKLIYNEENKFKDQA